MMHEFPARVNARYNRSVQPATHRPCRTGYAPESDADRLTMNQLEQLKQFTTVVADTGNFKQLAQFAPRDATTTRP